MRYFHVVLTPSFCYAALAGLVKMLRRGLKDFVGRNNTFVDSCIKLEKELNQTVRISMHTQGAHHRFFNCLMCAAACIRRHILVKLFDVWLGRPFPCDHARAVTFPAG